MKKLILIFVMTVSLVSLAQATCVKIDDGKESPLTGTERGYTIDKSSLGALQKEFKGVADQAFTGDTDTCSDPTACKGKKHITCHP